jgi:hypothetical protein
LNDTKFKKSLKFLFKEAIEYLVILAIVLFLFTCYTNLYPHKTEIGEFVINDLSKPAFFVDSLSGISAIEHGNISFKISGKIDSSAEIRYLANSRYLKNFINNNDSISYEERIYKLKKGEIDISTQMDHYDGDTLWIKFIPRGSKKGSLKITSNIN